MPALARFALCILVAASPAARVSADPPDDPTALAEAYFDETERFDALLSFESRRGPASMVFTLARRFRGGLAELLFDIREPTAFRKWALLARQTRAGSDDLFAYFAEATGPARAAHLGSPPGAAGGVQPVRDRRLPPARAGRARRSSRPG